MHTIPLKSKRLTHIDFLRSIGVISIIVIHTFSYNLASPLLYFIWNYLHFDVAAFVFCSGYILTAKYENSFNNYRAIIRWYQKRMIRLLIPFYIYFCIHFTLWALFPEYFYGLGFTKSFGFIVQSLSFTGGLDANWLPLLFIELAFLFPLLICSLKKRNILFLYASIAIAATIYFTAISFPYTYYRYVMWLPWSLLLLFSMLMFRQEQNSHDMIGIGKYYVMAAFFGFSLFYIMWHTGYAHDRLIDHKYPPDLFYLSYALAVTCVLFLVGRLHTVQSSFVTKILRNISEQSYELYFIHYIVLDFVLKNTKNMPILSSSWIQLACVLSASILISNIIYIDVNMQLKFQKKCIVNNE